MPSGLAWQGSCLTNSFKDRNQIYCKLSEKKSLKIGNSVVIQSTIKSKHTYWDIRWERLTPSLLQKKKSHDQNGT